MVEPGSSALVGSSISSTSGLTANARAMQRRCCCPPDRPRALFFQAVLHLVPQGCAPQRFPPARPARPYCARRAAWGAVGDVVVDAHGEGVCLLEHHAHAAAQVGQFHLAGKNILALQPYIPSMRTPGTRSFMRFRVFKKVDLPQPEGPMSAVISPLAHVQRMLFSAFEVAVPEVQILCRYHRHIRVFHRVPLLFLLLLFQFYFRQTCCQIDEQHQHQQHCADAPCGG